MRGELGGFNQNQVREILQMFRDEIIKKIYGVVREILQMFRDEIIKKIYGVRGRRRMEV